MPQLFRCIRALTTLPVLLGLVLGAVAVGALGPAPASAAPNTSGRCAQYEDALRRYAPPGGWDVEVMSTVMWRESACDPAARSARDTGLLQINDINHAHLREVLGEWVGRWSLTEPVQNIRAAAALCTYWQLRGESCYFPWKLDLYRLPSTGVTTAVPPATAVTATTTAPPAPAPAAPVSGRCVQYETALAAQAPATGWDVQRMSKLMFTMSGCDPTRRWRTATGLLRISDVNHTWLRSALGRPVDRTTMADPVENVRAAAALCRASVARGRSCYQPWTG